MEFSTFKRNTYKNLKKMWIHFFLEKSISIQFCLIDATTRSVTLFIFFFWLGLVGCFIVITRTLVWVSFITALLRCSRCILLPKSTGLLIDWNSGSLFSRAIQRIQLLRNKAALSLDLVIFPLFTYALGASGWLFCLYWLESLWIFTSSLSTTDTHTGSHLGVGFFALDWL